MWLNIFHSTDNFLGAKNDKWKHLYCPVAIVIVCDHCPNPSPIVTYDKLGNGSGLVEVTGDGSKEGSKLEPVTETGAGRKITDLKDTYKSHTFNYSDTTYIITFYFYLF